MWEGCIEERTNIFFVDKIHVGDAEGFQFLKRTPPCYEQRFPEEEEWVNIIR